MTIQELALCAVESMIDYGYKPITAWRTYENNLSHIVKMHVDCGANSIKEDIVNEYAEIAKKKCESGEISYNNMRFRANAAERFLEFATIGIWARPKLENRIHLNPYYEGLAHQLIPALTEANGWGHPHRVCTPGTLGDILSSWNKMDLIHLKRSMRKYLENIWFGAFPYTLDRLLFAGEGN